jgi:hypothetical protein
MASESTTDSVAYLSVFVANFNTANQNQRGLQLLQAAYDEAPAGIHMLQNHHGHPQIRATHTSVRDINTGMVITMAPSLGILDGHTNHGRRGDLGGWDLQVARAVLNPPRASMQSVNLVNVCIYNPSVFQVLFADHEFWDVLARIVVEKHWVIMAGHFRAGSSLVVEAMNMRGVDTCTIMDDLLGHPSYGKQCMFRLSSRTSPQGEVPGTRSARTIITRTRPALGDRWVPELSAHMIVPTRPISVVFWQRGDRRMRSDEGQARERARRLASWAKAKAKAKAKAAAQRSLTRTRRNW